MSLSSLSDSWGAPNKGILAFYSPLKSSFTLSKLRFFGFRRPKNTSCYARPEVSWEFRLKKNTMKKLLLVVAMAFAALSLSVGGAQAQELANATPYVAVNGSSQVKVTPDEIYLRITLDEGDTKGKDIIEAQYKRLFSALRKCNVDVEKHLSLLDMSSEYYRRGSSLATTQYELKLTSAESVGAVFEALDKDGITNVSVTRTASSKIDDYRRQARQEAIRNAQSRARDLAEAIGQSIGACFEINDYTSEARVTNSRVMMAKNAVADMTAEEFAEPNVEFEQIVINYNVSAKFVLNTK